MDRKITWLAGSLISLIAQGAWASGGTGEEFPTSRFGSPPAEIDAGAPKISAATEAEDWSPRPQALMSGRSPASSLPPVISGAGRLSDTDRPPTGADLPTIMRNRKGVQEVAIIAGDLGYFPKTIFVNPDIPVRMFITGASKGSLCLMMDSFQVRKQVKSQRIEEITFTPNAPGRYRFYCPMNGMEGTLVVREMVSEAAPQEP